MQEMVELTNRYGKAIGVMEKLEAHKRGFLHRAVSIFLFNTRGEFLLQRRADSKYHSPGLWSNTCCTHPRPGEDITGAANRRLMEEMGITCALQPRFTFIYRTPVGNGLLEFEYDHVFTGITTDLPQSNLDEVAAWQFISPDSLQYKLQAEKETFTAWFPLILEQLKPVL
jgi:isopentenyl-diphosphate delta-isomerase